MKKIKVFVIPYAGGSSLAYYSWQKYFPDDIEICYIEFPGRGCRMEEPFMNNLEELIEDVSKQIISQLDGEDYFIYGHSMGALIAFEVYYNLKEKGIRLPKHIFFSGRKAPQIPFTGKKSENLDDKEFLEIVSLFGGLPNEFYTNQDVRDLFLPILRSDFKILEEYKYVEKSEKLNCNISVMYGDCDFSTSQFDIQQWKIHGAKRVNFYKFSGDHFFINENYKEIINLIVKEYKMLV